MPEFKIGTSVILNDAGENCYNRNKSDKTIPLNETMIILGTAGFDNGHDIYKVKWSDNVDYYFDYCLKEV